MSFEVPRELTDAWRAKGWYVDRTYADAFIAAARDYPDTKLVIVSDSRPATVTLADTFEAARRVAGGLCAHGFGEGDIIAVQTPNWLETVLVHAAVALIGAVVLPIVHIYGVGEIDFILEQSGAKALVTPDQWRGVNYVQRQSHFAERHPGLRHIVVGKAPDPAITWAALTQADPIEAVVSVDPGDVALLIYTSGTTSAPKGVQHSHRSFMAELLTAPERPGDDSYTLSPWPPGHVAGVMGLGRFWLMGNPTVLMEVWNAATAARLIEQYRIAKTSGTPFHLSSLLDEAESKGRDISSLTEYLAGATMIPPALIARCQALGLCTYRSYGLSEQPTVSRGAPDDALDKRLNTDGRLCPGVQVRIVDDENRDLPVGAEGEILSRGPERFIGYHDAARNEDVLLPGGWLRTGDIGRMDADGFLSITDRKKDIIIRGGENIASREVEDILATLPGVREAAVVGMPHPVLGEKVCAFIIASGDEPVTLERVAAHFQAKGIARQKTPERIVLVDELPRNATGKVLKQPLRAQLSDEKRPRAQR